MVYRIYVTRQNDYALDSRRLLRDLRESLATDLITGLRLYNRYDIENIAPQTLEEAKYTVLSEPQTDICRSSIDAQPDDTVFAVEYLPGQFDQRADSCAQCIQLIAGGERPIVRTATVYCLSGNISDALLARIKAYIINPVDSREASPELPQTLDIKFDRPADVRILDGFTELKDSELDGFISEYGLAMDTDDLRFCRSYFSQKEHRCPTLTELRLIDTYWSDHCRHTTFLTQLCNVKICDPYIGKTFEEYKAAREKLYAGRKDKPVTLMDVATIAAKLLVSEGGLTNIDKSEEINACSIKIKVDVDGRDEDWLLMFKNETHNHPTEIEPFGGAATCLGGAIRDPLSGRSYVYHAMRVTGAADPRVPVSETIKGKLPQKKLTLGAASGFSSYGNQIGLATGLVHEFYHPDYAAKRMEIGAVVGAAPEANVVRTVPVPGDIVILLGGRTGRDGCGGATGSSKAHTSSSLSTCGAEVQKGNPPEERKIQRLFRNPAATRLVKRCNDFGAGGVSVAIGELADGLSIDLSAVPKKYEGLDGTELAISESQERMAVVVSPKDAKNFCMLAAAENLEATIVAKVTDNERMTMNWRGETVVDLSREFLNSNGAPKHTDVYISSADASDILQSDSRTVENFIGSDPEKAFTALLSDLSVCSQRGLAERFDSTIGAGTVIMPYGGKYEETPAQYMAAKLPVGNAETDTASFMAFGFDPYLSKRSPYHGALYAVVESVTKLVCSGINYKDAYLTFQEYFEKPKGNPERFGKPLAALLGAYAAQTGLGIAAIGGKDSMSGSFESMDVPPTLVSFAIAPGKASAAITPEFKKSGSSVYLLSPHYSSDGLPYFDDLRTNYEFVHNLALSGKLLSAYSVGTGGIAEAISKMSFGNRVGCSLDSNLPPESLYGKLYGSFILETDLQLESGTAGGPDISVLGQKALKCRLIGTTEILPAITYHGKKIKISTLEKAWASPLEQVFPTKPDLRPDDTPIAYTFDKHQLSHSKISVAKPRVLITVFPGTNCEYDSARAFERAGGKADIFVFRNLTPSALSESIDALAEKIQSSQIFMLPGGFSGGDEPDGSGKFICAVLRNQKIRDAVGQLLYRNDGLMLGICNGFQALLKVGLLPLGKITDKLPADAPTLTYNTIGRHQSVMVRTRIASVKSPWLAGVSVNDVYTIPVSHGEGRFVASPELIDKMARAGQIATQYADLDGMPTMSAPFNPNGSAAAIEGIITPGGRILGKMGHSERTDNGLYRNITGNFDQLIFRSGVEYYK